MKGTNKNESAQTRRKQVSKKKDDSHIEKEISLQELYDAESALLIAIAIADYTVPFVSIHAAVAKIFQINSIIVAATKLE